MLQAGAAMVDITPRLGTHLSGSGMGDHRPARSVLDPLYAKAVVLRSGGKKICFLSLDVTIVTEEFTVPLRRTAGERFGFEPDAVMVHAIQTHSAPSCGRFMLDPDFPLQTTPETEYLWGTESEYFEFALKRAAEAIEKANASLEPVQVGVGVGRRDDLACNRRQERTIDPEVGVLCLRAPDGRVPAMLLHYTCHPVNAFCKGWNDPDSYHAVSADWPGVWARQMQATCGADCVPLVLNGCCGNINPCPYDPASDWDHRRQGKGLAETAHEIVRGMSFAQTGRLDWRVRRVPLSYRDVPPERMAAVDKILSENPQPKWRDDGSGQVAPEWFHAASTKGIEYCRRRMPEFLYEVQVFRVGDIAFVGLPGEPFCEGQLELKKKSPAPFTFVAHCTSQYVGYVPTREACARGGHEANEDCTYWAKLAPEALELVIANALDMLGQLYRD